MTPLAALAILGAGCLAGLMNSIVGSGSLITFPTLVALGLSPFVANVTNNVGLVLGNFSAVYGYRRELEGRRDRIRSLVGWSAAGGALGAVLLVVHRSAFRTVVPWLVLLAVALVAFQPLLSRWQRLNAESGHPMVLRTGMFLTGVYGGYFGAAQGVILIALLATTLRDDLQRLNGLKNLAVGLVNLLAGVIFVIVAPVDWSVAGLISVASVIGAQIGTRVGRRLPQPVLRAVIVAGGLAVSIYLLS